MKKQEGSTSSDIKKAAEIIKSGGIIIFPTDTVYGIGCRFDNQKSVNMIYKIKSRPKNLPFPVLLNDVSQLKKIATVTTLANDLIKRYWPGGLTIVLKRKSSGEKIGFRIPASQLVLDLILESRTPIIGTSANFHGKPSVKNSKDLDPKIAKIVDYVIEGECAGGIESTVVDAVGKNPIIIRKGAINIKSLGVKIDTTKREEVTVLVSDNWSSLKDKVVISQQTGSQSLIPAIVKILKKNKSTVKDLTSISVNIGPGSFTGTRVGVAVANALGFALDIPVNSKLGKIAVPVYEESRFD